MPDELPHLPFVPETVSLAATHGVEKPGEGFRGELPKRKPGNPKYTGKFPAEGGAVTPGVEFFSQPGKKAR